MFLLNPKNFISVVKDILVKFTIQNVSIKSDENFQLGNDNADLQYKMFLLNQKA